MIRLLLCAFLFSFTISSCSNAKFEREKSFFAYLKDIHQYECKESCYVVVLQTGFCGACTTEVVDFVSKEMVKKNKNTVLILAEENLRLIDKLERANEEMIILVDKNYAIEKYGLRHTSDLFFFVQNNTIETWSTIDEDKYKRILKIINAS